MALVWRMFLLLPLVASVLSEVTEKDLKEKLGIDVSSLREVSWKEWVNNNPGPASISNACIAPPEATHCTEEVWAQCWADSHCNDSMAMAICSEGRCVCDEDHFPNENGTLCEYRPRKELGESCGPMDNCYVAYAACINGTCHCRPSFMRIKDVCKPIEYACPYKKPLMRNGVVWPCKMNSSENNTCPKGYSCLIPEFEPYYEIHFLSPSGSEQSYCCPNVPDVNLTTINYWSDVVEPEPKPRKKLFDDVCVFGKPYSGDGCPTGHYLMNFGLGLVCCPEPCLRYILKKMVIKNGKCTYEKLDRQLLGANSPPTRRGFVDP